MGLKLNSHHGLTMKNPVKIQFRGKIIPFPSRQYSTQGDLVPSQAVVTLFIRLLTQNDFPAILQLIEQQGEHLATLQGNYFSLPLHIAGLNCNVKLMSFLVDKGADPKLALDHPRYKLLPTTAQHFLKSLCEMGGKVSDRIKENHLSLVAK